VCHECALAVGFSAAYGKSRAASSEMRAESVADVEAKSRCLGGGVAEWVRKRGSEDQRAAIEMANRVICRANPVIGFRKRRLLDYGNVNPRRRHDDHS